MPCGRCCPPPSHRGAAGTPVSSDTDLAPSPCSRVFLLLLPPLSWLACPPPGPGARLLTPRSLPAPEPVTESLLSDLRSPSSWQALFNSAPSLPCLLPASHPTQTRPLPPSYRIPVLKPQCTQPPSQAQECPAATMQIHEAAALTHRVTVKTGPPRRPPVTPLTWVPWAVPGAHSQPCTYSPRWPTGCSNK